MDAAPKCEALKKYQELLRTKPIATKAITSAVISVLGQIIGAWIRNKKLTLSKQDLKKCVIFAFYGLITGPFFHWWYGTLEKISNSFDMKMRLLVKLLSDRLVMTPPFLLGTLAFLNYFQNLDAKSTAVAIRQSYWPALRTNWQVWTVAQYVNFQYVPLDYRVLFGNLVALWWNIYLSLKS